MPTQFDCLFYLAQAPGPGIVQLTIRVDLVSAVKLSWKPPPSRHYVHKVSITTFESRQRESEHTPVYGGQTRVFPCMAAGQGAKSELQKSASPTVASISAFWAIASQDRAWGQRLHFVVTGALQPLCRWETQFRGYPGMEGGGEVTASSASSSALDLGLGGALSLWSMRTQQVFDGL